MPLKLGKKKFANFAKAKKAVAGKGIKNPAAYVAAIERAQGVDPRTGKKIKPVPTSKQKKKGKGKKKKKE